VHHSIVKSQQAEVEELESAKRRAEALEKQLRDLGVEPKVAAVAVAKAPADATQMAVREFRMDNGARRVQIMATNGPAGSLGSGSMGPGTLIAEFDAVTRVRDEVEGDHYICNVYGPDGKTVINQVAVPKGPMGGAEIIHVAKVQVHNAPTQQAIEHQQMLIAQGKLRAPGAVVSQPQRKQLPVEITLEGENEQTVSHADATEERFALIELGETQE
jgi:hypothetical protein